MNDVERRLRDLGEKAREDVTAPLRARPAALRRIRRRRGLLSGTAALSLVAVVAGGIGLAGLPAERDLTPPAQTPSAHPQPEPRCRIAFAPTYLPAGIDAVPLPGSGGHDDLEAAEQQGVIGHFRGPKGTYIDVMDTPPGRATDRARLEIFGAPATLGSIHEGYSVEFRAGRCDYTLAGYGLVRSELRRFATSLIRVGRPPTAEPGLVVWPEDTADGAEAGCARAAARERTGPAVVFRFATEVLGWESPLVAPSSTGSHVWTVKPSGGGAYGGDVEAGVEIATTEIVPRCFSISSVSRLRDRRPTGVGVSVHGDLVTVAYDPLGAHSVSVEIGYGGSDRTVHDEPPLDSVRVRLGSPPRTTGHFLILFRDEQGRVFSAAASTLPAGDFAAG
jgi:hypothetical protein